MARKKSHVYKRHGVLYFRTGSTRSLETFYGKGIRNPRHKLHSVWLKQKRLENRRRAYKGRLTNERLRVLADANLSQATKAYRKARRKKRKSSPRHIHF